ncbi:MAG TPA: DUF721 domain-containing protein [Terriglobia bacterium]|nr:DUF721 domain-containing protein [Terriglobia bacterium]
MNELSSLLPGFLRQLHFSEELTGELVIALWKNVVGETLARNARPLRMRESTLVLTVSSEAWKKELFSLRFEILGRLEKLLGSSKISGLELRVDPWMTTVNPSAAEQPPSQPGVEPTGLPLDSISDPELRRSLAAVASSYFGRKTK